MNKNIKIYIGILVFVFTLILLADKGKPKEIDWRPTYDTADKIPFGLYVFDHEIKGFFKNQKVERISIQTPYEFLVSKLNEDADFNPYEDPEANPDENDFNINTYTIRGTFLNISEADNIDEQSMKEVFDFVSNGNTAFLSMKAFPKILLDSLKIQLKTDFLPADSISVWMANKKISTKKYVFNTGLSDYFSKIDTLNTTILGYQNRAHNQRSVNFIKVPFNNGFFYLHTQPAAFTNYNLLRKDNFQYAENVLSYISKYDVFWYTKPLGGEKVSDSSMRYFLSQPALKWGWYLFLIGMLIFMIFNAKRKQRIVPIIKPLSNSTVDFTKTIGNLYYQEGDHTNIIDKKIIYFLEKIRNEYLIDTTKLNEEFIKKLHHKTGKNSSDIEELVYLINEHRKSYHGSLEEDLIRINNAIEKILN
ncbi:DUF4350 domain-containing protein [Flavobacterium foetidum]|uniref:DUF4350 domain-containing protein n=1 Tax=Flavobacterium foetidum TaxID=2026681 RepID=UPI00107566D1|nr:DUF4350 domain-containing protein [Flavobacterium foetidum]KAF2516518.1 DUF4350 domain-containing protein [Flavobacterium foetidum]